MSEEKRKILEMLADKKITVDDAEKLLAAVSDRATEAAGDSAGKTGPKYLRVLVEPAPGDPDGERVNIRVPLNLVRAGLKFASFIPARAQEKINREMKDKGVPFDLSHFNPQDVEALLVHLNDLTVEVEGKEKVRVFCE
ncbi:MAG: hypothetical protein L6428_10330 [Candidatus Aminicenantes bacterium]|nr:hypothetical protein [Acidobacteriota bacterium]MCG2811839.1 hypothetical protein [Candidatus Aminicenantes bacterium]